MGPGCALEMVAMPLAVVNHSRVALPATSAVDALTFIGGADILGLILRAILQTWGFPRMDNSIFERVRDIIVDQLGVSADAVVPAARFREDLHADSLDLVELIMRFEEEFGGEISDKEAEGITTVGEAVAYLQSHQAA